eukprot:4656990-Pleurochrysis_carterae.AAC.2
MGMLDINKDNPIYFDEPAHNIVPLRPSQVIYTVSQVNITHYWSNSGQGWEPESRSRHDRKCAMALLSRCILICDMACNLLIQWLNGYLYMMYANMLTWGTIVDEPCPTVACLAIYPHCDISSSFMTQPPNPYYDYFDVAKLRRNIVVLCVVVYERSPGILQPSASERSRAHTRKKKS